MNEINLSFNTSLIVFLKAILIFYEFPSLEARKYVKNKKKNLFSRKMHRNNSTEVINNKLLRR